MSESVSGPNERRRHRRSVVGMPIHAVRRGTPETDPRRLIGLHILNVSRGGIAAISQEVLGRREALLLLFPPLGPGRGRDTPGQVVRCDRAGDCYAVGVAFEEPWPEQEEALQR